MKKKIQTKRTMVSILAMVVGCFSKAVYIPFFGIILAYAEGQVL